MSRKQTRAQYYSINATALARRAKAKLAKIRAQIEDLQGPWAEVDPMIERVVSETLASIDGLAKAFAESSEYLNEPFDE